jgi:hypothetical protein
LKNIPAGPSSVVHRNLCAADKRNEASHFGAGSGGNRLSGERCSSENQTDLSIPTNINGVRPTLGTSVVCIIQVPGDNHHMEIIAIQKGSRTTYKGVPVTRFEAVRRHTANEPVIQKDHGPGAEFLFSLSQGDMVTWKENFWRVRGVTDDGQGRILLKLAKDARSITKVGKDDLPRPYVNGFISTGGRKIYVSPLGIIREAHD